MTTPTNPQEPLHAYVDWLLEIAAQLAVILEHMWRHHNPDAPESPRQVLNRLVRETIPPAWAARGRSRSGRRPDPRHLRRDRQRPLPRLR